MVRAEFVFDVEVEFGEVLEGEEEEAVLVVFLVLYGGGFERTLDVVVVGGRGR